MTVTILQIILTLGCSCGCAAGNNVTAKSHQRLSIGYNIGNALLHSVLPEELGEEERLKWKFCHYIIVNEASSITARVKPVSA